MSFIPKADDKKLFQGILKAMGRTTVSEERDPDDFSTNDMFGSHGHAYNDEPDFHTVHHQIHLHVTVGNKQVGVHKIGEKTYKRLPNESADDFDNRVTDGVMNGHKSYDEFADEHHTHQAMGPTLADGVRATWKDYGPEESGWMTGGVGQTHDHYMAGDEDKGPGTGVHTQVIHKIKVDE